jgi:hypothetical protein
VPGDRRHDPQRLQLHYATFQRVNGFNDEETNGMTETTFVLHQVLYDASDSDLCRGPSSRSAHLPNA